MTLKFKLTDETKVNIFGVKLFRIEATLGYPATLRYTATLGYPALVSTPKRHSPRDYS